VGAITTTYESNTGPYERKMSAMRNLTTNSRNQGFAGIARASYVCVMPAEASWSFPTILVATDHKPQPRRHRVASP
jgi:hypothetical protein